MDALSFARTVSGLTNGTPHTFQARAVNSVGGGAESTESTATPRTTPGAPQTLEASAGDAEVTLSWLAPSSDGGATITSYQYRYKTTGNYGNWSTVSGSGSARTVTVSSLTNATPHTFEVRARNTAGGGTASEVIATPAAVVTAPGPPTNVQAVPGVTSGSVKLSWLAPSSDGGADIDRYQYRYKTTGNYNSWRGNYSGSARSVTVSSLTNGMLHTFEVRAVNNAGDGTASEATATPTAANAEPVFTDGASTTRSVDENTASGQNVGSPVSATDADSDTLDYSLGGTDMASFAIVSTSGQIRTSAALDRESKSSYSLTVSVSDGNSGTASIAVTVNVGDVNEQPARPAAPSVGATSGSNTSLDVSWTAPGRNGGPAISGYNLQYREGTSGGWTNGPQNVSGTSRAIPGLVQGTAYQVQIQALNGETPSDWSLAGSGSTSSPTNAAPGPPTNVQAAPGVTSGSVRLSWSPPASDGGADIDRYQYRYKTTGNYPANWTTVNGGSSARSVTVSSLDNDTPHTFQVRAVNSAGDGTASEVIATPTGAATTTVPGALGSLNASAGDGRVTLRWSAPSSDGGAAITRYEYRYKTTGNYPVNWTTVPGSNATTTSYTVPSLTNGTLHTFQVRAVNSVGAGTASSEATATPTTTEDREDEPTTSVPKAPRNLTAVGGDGQVVLTWDAPASDGGAKITDYEYRIDGRGRWISIGSTLTTHTVTGLVNGREYTFQVRAVNRRGKGRVSSQAEAKPEVFILDFAHFANGDGLTSDLVFVNVASHPIRPALYFYDTEGQPMAAESVLDITGDLEIQEDGSLSIQTEMEPLAELTISTHGQGELVSGSVKVDADGPIGGGLRFDLPGIGVAGVGASRPMRDAVFPVRRQEGGINTGVAIHNLESSPEIVRCELMQEGVLHAAVDINLAANGQSSWFIDAAFPAADTSGFAGSVRCDAVGPGQFTAVALELDAASRIFTTLPVLPVRRAGGRAAELNFAHFANGAGLTSDLVFVNLSTERSRPAPTPFHSDILPARPVLYFYGTGGEPMAAESVVDITGDLEVMEDGGLTVLTEMEPLGVLTISTHGRGDLVTGSVRVIADEPIGGVLRFDLPGIGVAGVGVSSPISDAIFPVRRQEAGINTGVAVHNLGEEAMEVACELMQGGVVLDDVSIPLAANGQSSWFIDEVFTGADTSDFVGSVRCTAPGEGMFTGVAVELDAANRIFTTLPVVPVER